MTLSVKIDFSFNHLCIPLISKRTDQRLPPFHVCATFFFSSRSFWLFWSFWALIIYPYSLSQCHKRLCWVCFGGRAHLVLRLSRNSTECWEFRTGWQARTTTPTLPADFTQGLSMHPLSGTSTQPLWGYDCMKSIAGEAVPTQWPSVQPWWDWGWSDLCWRQSHV